MTPIKEGGLYMAQCGCVLRPTHRDIYRSILEIIRSCGTVTDRDGGINRHVAWKVWHYDSQSGVWVGRGPQPAFELHIARPIEP